MKTDPRVTPARPDLAAEHLRGRVDAIRYADGVRHCVKVPMLDLIATPESTALETQLRFGEVFTLYEEVSQTGLAWGQAQADGYVGYVRRDGLGEVVAANHRVQSLLSHVYPAADLKTRPLATLPFLSSVAVVRQVDSFAELATGGYIPAQHLTVDAQICTDPVTAAEQFLGCPYLWGGTTALGLDCSALVQLSLLACAKNCPRDSDMQEAALGRQLAEGEKLTRGDLVFWRGHVGFMTGDTTLLHANAHHMAVIKEPLADAARRIEGSGGGPVTSRRRLSLSPAG